MDRWVNFQIPLPPRLPNLHKSLEDKWFKVRWESYVIINEIQSMIASIQTPFPYYYSISLDYHHWPHFEIPFAKVSWVRHRDIHILTAGAYTYTSDQRFQALHRQNTGQNSEWSEWTLCIKWAQERDQGLYECQISTIPVKSHQFRLNVVSKSPSSHYIYIYILSIRHQQTTELTQFLIRAKSNSKRKKNWKENLFEKFLETRSILPILTTRKSVECLPVVYLETKHQPLTFSRNKLTPLLCVDRTRNRFAN